MEETIDLKPLALAEDDVFTALSDGHMAVLRAGRDFLYILRKDAAFFMFSHMPGSPEGGRKRLPEDEKSVAIVRNLIKIADSAYEVTFAEAMDVRGVMVSAEEGILELFPIGDEEGGADIEFVIPGENGEDEFAG
ncbi:MAG: hypothetical protein LBL36_04575 [Clostridiales Family XIII bacterium]|jgi:hypothetical protein|nr:hypothetical protein [Clostridiales Family XIII bacterium]